MDSFEVGKPFSVNELAKRVKVHHSTAKKAVKFFLALQEIGIPQSRDPSKQHPVKE